MTRLQMLNEIATSGRAVCDSFEMRRLWYAGLVHWVSITEVGLTTDGLAELYRSEEQGKL